MRRGNAVGRHLLLIAAVVLMLLPVAWALSTSFKPVTTIFDLSPIPIPASLENYQLALNRFAIGRLLLVVENYPQLKSNENFLRLQDELAGTENRIAVERKRYNDSIQDYNTYIGLFPNNIFAGWAGFQRNNAYFTATESAREAPKVQFPAPTR